MHVQWRDISSFVECLVQCRPAKSPEVTDANPAAELAHTNRMPEETKYAKDKRLRVEKLLERIEAKEKQGKKKKPAKLIPPKK